MVNSVASRSLVMSIFGYVNLSEQRLADSKILNIRSLLYLLYKITMELPFENWLLRISTWQRSACDSESGNSQKSPRCSICYWKWLWSWLLRDGTWRRSARASHSTPSRSAALASRAEMYQMIYTPYIPKWYIHHIYPNRAVCAIE